jgi:tRNA dimethylallyltransferase
MNKTQLKKMHKAIVITGPTASGKTELSLQLAKELDTEIISADSRQVYKMMDICTAKPSKNELSSVKHHLVDVLNPDEDYSAGKFARDAKESMDRIVAQGKIPIICGGTLFYIKALFEGLFQEKSEGTNHDIRSELNNKFEQEGIEPLLEQLKEVDREMYDSIEKSNKQRVIRALEYFLTNGEKLSEAQKRQDEQLGYKPHYFAIDFPREELYQRINQRCEIMWNSGLIDEYKSIINAGYSDDLNSMNTVGYKETSKYLDGEWDKDKAIEEFKKNTRRFAKRQLTWLRGMENLHWLSHNMNTETKIKEIKKCLNI